MSPAEREQRYQELERERLRIQAEITSYPMPIPACDVYFNDLLERRGRISAQMKELEQDARTNTLDA